MTHVRRVTRTRTPDPLAHTRFTDSAGVWTVADRDASGRRADPSAAVGRPDLGSAAPPAVMRPHLREARVVYRPTRRPLQRIQADAPIAGPSVVGPLLATLTEDRPQEVFAVMTLTTKHHPIRFYEISVGTLDATLIHPREIFRPAILDNAAALIATHNHPSGDPEPSREDRAVTARLSEAGTLLGFTLLDHIVTGHRGRYFSFREAGWMP